MRRGVFRMRGAGWIAAAVAVAGLLAGCAAAAPEPEQRPITRVEVGDCFDTDAEYTTALVYPDCSAPHLYEAFHVEVLDGDTFPGDAAVATRADEVCNAQFQVFTGVPVAQSTEYASMYMAPTEQSWMTEDDRSIVCVTMPFDGTPRAGSAGAAG